MSTPSNASSGSRSRAAVESARRPLRTAALLFAVLALGGWAWIRGDARSVAADAPREAPIAAAVSDAGAVDRAPGTAAPPDRSEWPHTRRGYLVRTVLHSADGTPREPRAEWRVRWRRASGGDRTLELRESFELPEATAGDRLVVLDARLGEQLVTPRATEVLLAGEREVVLIGDLPPDGALRVVDARDGEELDEVLLVPWTCAEGAPALPPLRALEQGCARRVEPPITLPANRRHTTNWIGAEGFAWRRIEYGRSSGSPIYALEPGGDMDISVEPPRDGSWRYVAVLEGPVGRSAAHRVLAEEPLRPGKPLSFAGLAAGRHLVTFLARQEGRADVAIAERSVDVVAGQRAELSFDLDALWRPESFGRLHVYG